ncbi:MAG: hypothetical protein HQ568_03275 [Calditrichaeota bacterium]|nr:hypothetical protein [Calditrichota bacterium]
MKFFFDNTFSYKLIKCFRCFLVLMFESYEIEHLQEKFNDHGIKDHDWLKEVAGKGNWIVLTGDSHLRTNPANKKVFDEFKLTIFIFGGKFVNNNGWDQTWKLVKVWPKIIEISNTDSYGKSYKINNNLDINEW